MSDTLEDIIRNDVNWWRTRGAGAEPEWLLKVEYLLKLLDDARAELEQQRTDLYSTIEKRGQEIDRQMRRAESAEASLAKKEAEVAELNRQLHAHIRSTDEFGI